jgi:hypothetical protein
MSPFTILDDLAGITGKENLVAVGMGICYICILCGIGFVISNLDCQQVKQRSHTLSPFACGLLTPYLSVMDIALVSGDDDGGSDDDDGGDDDQGVVN